MSATGQPYSDRALEAANCQFGVPQALDAAHDREALGLDASVCAREYRREVFTELARSFRADPNPQEAEDAALFAYETSMRLRRSVIDDVVEFLDGLCTQYGDRAARAVLREFESNGGKP